MNSKLAALLYLLFFVLGQPCLPARLEAAEAEDFQTLVDEIWEFDMRENPLFATAAGDHRYNDRLPGVSVADSTRQDAAKQKFFERLQAIDREALSPTDRINYDILTRQLKNGLAEFQFQQHLLPIDQRTGFHIDFAELPKNMPLNSTKDYENFIARLRAFGDYTDGHIALMRAGMAAGQVLPAVVLEGWEQSVDAQIVDDPTQSLLYDACDEFPNAVAESERQRLRQEIAAAIGDVVVPAYRRFRTFMADEYVPSARGSIGASALPNGRDFYRHRVRKFTTLDVTPEEVHNLGLAEVKRIRGEMDEIIRRVEFDGDFAAFTKFLREDPQFYAENKEQLLKAVAYALKSMDGQLPTLFGKLPRTPYGMREVPDYVAPRTTSAYYQLPAGDGTRAGFFYVNTYNLKSRPLYDVEALSFHEAVPGHHLQLALQQEIESMPMFRRFGGFTAFVEGWALYSERLGLEVGFYKDPYSDFGRLSMEMWRACRLVVDTGMHYFGWTRQQAIDFMIENSALSEHNIRAEVDRYISWPGQALGYKMGELKIRQLRARAEEQLGERFDIREFHDLVLSNGAVPLDVLEANVDEWLQAK